MHGFTVLSQALLLFRRYSSLVCSSRVISVVSTVEELILRFVLALSPPPLSLALYSRAPMLLLTLTCVKYDAVSYGLSLFFCIFVH